LCCVTFWAAVGRNFLIWPPNLSQNWCCWQSLHHVCWTKWMQRAMIQCQTRSW
jgi:hypothetical protein